MKKLAVLSDSAIINANHITYTEQAISGDWEIYFDSHDSCVIDKDDYPFLISQIKEVK